MFHCRRSDLLGVHHQKPIPRCTYLLVQSTDQTGKEHIRISAIKRRGYSSYCSYDSRAATNQKAAFITELSINKEARKRIAAPCMNKPWAVRYHHNHPAAPKPLLSRKISPVTRRSPPVPRPQKAPNVALREYDQRSVLLSSRSQRNNHGPRGLDRSASIDRRILIIIIIIKF